MSRFAARCTQTTTQRQPTQRRGGLVFSSLILLFFLGLGVLGSVLLGREILQRVQMRFWNPVECVILESRVIEEQGSSTPYRVYVRYAYSWQDRSFTGDRWARGAGGFSDYRDASSSAARYVVDTKAVCYIDPKNPGQAVLARPSLWMGLFIFVPLIFVAVGGGGLLMLWRRPAAGRAEASGIEPARPKTILAESVVRRGPVLAGFLFGVFLLVGGVLTYCLLWRPWTRVQSAKTWPALPCTVVSSRVQTHSDSDSTTYSVDILYAYEVDGREFRSSRYAFLGGSSSGWAGKAAIVQRYPAGSKAVCYVNPLDPTEAVLERRVTAGMWLGIIPLSFVLVGVAGLVGVLCSRLRSAADPSWSGAGAGGGREGAFEPGLAVSGAIPAPTSFATHLADPAAPRVLKPTGSRIGAFIFLLVFTAIWNGVVFFGILRGGVLKGSGAWGWIGTLFSLPFLVVGVVMLAITLYQLLALSNPTAELTINPGAPTLGAALEVSWRLTGRTHRLRGLRLSLAGREEATHRQGTRTQTDRRVFFTLNVAELDATAELANGMTRFTVPADSVPSFRSANNRIIWAIEVRGEIPRWPDLKEEFEIQVRPGARMAAA